MPHEAWRKWLLAALIAPVCTLASGCGWGISLIAVSGLCLGAVTSRFTECPRYLAAGQLVWAMVMLAQLLQLSSKAWLSPTAWPAVPLVLLALAAWACSHPLRACRSGAACFWAAAGLVGFFLLQSIPRVQIQYLRPAFWGEGEELFSVLLLTGTGWLLCPNHRQTAAPTGLLAILVSVSVGGVLSPAVAKQVSHPFLEMSRSGHTLEAPLCAGLTVGWFCTVTYLLVLASTMLDILLPVRIKNQIPQPMKSVSLALLAAAMLLCRFAVDGQWLAVGSLLFWVIFPAVTQLICKWRK